MNHSEAGKGDAPRKQQDQKAYDEGWDRIFGKKPKRNTFDEIVEGFDSMKKLEEDQNECND